MGLLLMLTGCVFAIAGRIFVWKDDASFDPSSGYPQASLWKYVWIPFIFLAIILILMVALTIVTKMKGKKIQVFLLLLCLVVVVVMVSFTLFAEVDSKRIVLEKHRLSMIPGFSLHSIVFLFTAYLCPLLISAGILVIGSTQLEWNKSERHINQAGCSPQRRLSVKRQDATFED